MNLTDPVIQTAVVPFAVSLAAAALLAFSIGRRYAPLGLALGFFIAYWLIMGLPPLPPRGSAQKLPYLTLLATLFGLVVEIAATRLTLLRPTLALALPLAVGVWLGWRGLTRGDVDNIATIAALFVVGSAILLAYRQPPETGRRGLEAPAVALVLALTMGALALLGHSASTAQLAFALAAALGGVLILNWPTQRFPFAGLGVFAAFGTLLALSGQMLLYSDASRIGLAIAALVAASPLAAQRFKLPAGRSGDVLAPLVTGMVALVPAAIAVGIGFALAPGGQG
ncbi:MAG: hypothetical protein QF754_13970 [Alphaproteobacteria bacterium]|nr:hypothetical protein [Alphaproteobacteria bacterium]